MNRRMLSFSCLVILAAGAACLPQAPGASAVSPTTDHIAAGVAERRALAATQTAEGRAIASTLTAENWAVESTLSAEVPTVAPSPTPEPPAIQSPAEGIYFSMGDSLLWMDYEGGGARPVADGLRLAEQMAVDAAGSRLFISRWDRKDQILVFDPTAGEGVRPFADGPADGAQGLAIDPETSALFVGFYYDGVFRMDTPSAGWTQLVSAASLAPLHGQRGQLQIDPGSRHVYFRTAFNSDCDACRYIWRAGYDGGGLKKILRANGGDALALDLTGGKMYFSDTPGNSAVKRAGLDGSGVETLLTVPAPYTFCRLIVLDVARNSMYLSLYSEYDGYRSRAIARADLDGSGYRLLFEYAADTAELVAGGMALV